MSLKIMKLANRPAVDAIWDKPSWQNAPAIIIENHMGRTPEHFPRTMAKIAYDDEALYVIFKVDDRYVRAVADSHQGNVCRDSCVEFFFTPGTDTAAGYFNLEMNCGGTMLFHFQVEPRKDRAVISESDIRQIEVAHTMPRIVEPEMNEPVTWQVEYRIPINILEKIHPL
ncbi:MAG: carbohydrate-binding family 9-like protein, partial [Spirochaetales bacterium]|nr:carbohydrate-binding family 9-like protein [Spirochaetales bacterium]